MRTKLAAFALILGLPIPSAADVQDGGNLIIGQQGVVAGTMTVQGNSFSVGGSTFVVVGGNVGMGTASPKTPLDVSGSATIRGQQTVTSTFTVQGTAFSVAGTSFSVSGGILNAGAQPGVRATANTANPIAQASIGYLFFGSVDFSRQGMFDVSTDSSTVKIPPGGTGIYLIRCSARWPANGNGRRDMYIEVNGVAGITTGQIVPPSGAFMTTISDIFVLNAGDAIRCKLYQESGVTLDVIADSATSITVLKLW